jgi:ubiquinone/menaquinone biosynthesis C-methylase UbiE
MITNKIVPFVPKSVDFSNFADKNYWLERYENTKNTSEWYDDYETIKPLIYQLNISKRSVILHVGIGNSEFSEKMYDDGFKKSYNIDFARNVIHFMKLRNKRLRNSMIFETMDALNVEYEDEQFDVIFDKATFDCILCDIGADKKAKIYIKEIYRLLKPKGYYFLISNSEPTKRIKCLRNSNMKFNVAIYKIENEEEDNNKYDMLDFNMNVFKKTHYVYICKKMEEAKIIEDENLDDNDEEEKKDISNGIENKKAIEEKDKDKKDNIEKESLISYISLEEFQKVEKTKNSEQKEE